MAAILRASVSRAFRLQMQNQAQIGEAGVQRTAPITRDLGMAKYGQREKQEQVFRADRNAQICRAHIEITEGESFSRASLVRRNGVIAHAKPRPTRLPIFEFHRITNSAFRWSEQPGTRPVCSALVKKAGS